MRIRRFNENISYHQLDFEDIDMEFPEDLIPIEPNKKTMSDFDKIGQKSINWSYDLRGLSLIPYVLSFWRSDELCFIIEHRERNKRDMYYLYRYEIFMDDDYYFYVCFMSWKCTNKHGEEELHDCMDLAWWKCDDILGLENLLRDNEVIRD
jgi:phenylalanyl-tRNA synthetase alpha subunit